MGDTVIILQDECVLVAEGNRGKIPEIHSLERIGIDVFSDPFEQWKQALEKYTGQHHLSQVKVVLPTSYSSSRVIQIPYAKGKQLSRIAENVMSENYTEEMMDYAVIHSDKTEGICLCCGGAEEEVLTKINAIGNQLNFSIREVSVPMESYLNLLTGQKELQNHTVIVLVFEEASVTSILFREGHYLYSTRNRIFSERGTLDFGTEIVRTISGILQFYATTKSDLPIKEVYYTGCSTDDFIVSEEGIHAMNLTVAPLKFQTSKGGLLCTGAFVSEKKKELNLQNVWKEQTGTGGLAIKKQSIGKHLLFPVLTFGVCLILFLAVTLWNGMVIGEIHKLNDWIESPEIEEAYFQAKAKKEESERLSAALNQVEEMKANLATYPDLNDSMIRRIVDVGGSNMSVRIKTMDAQTGVLTFDAVSAAVIDIPTYVAKLENTGLFSSVNYSGYSYSDDEYSLALSCVLKGIETRGED